MKFKYIILTAIIWFSYLVINYINYFRNSYYDISIGLDSYIPVIALFIIPYLLAIPFMFLPYFLTDDEKVHKKIFYSFCFIIILSDIIFLLFPTKMSRIDVNSILNVFYSLELPYNLFPSLHVSIVFLSQAIAISLDREMKWLIPLSILIIISTLFIKQHYILDVIGGLVVGYLGYLVYRTFK